MRCLMKRNMLYRILRTDKLIIAALEATLRLYLDTSKILKVNPALRFLSRPLEEIESMSRLLMDSLMERLSDVAVIEIEDGYSQVGPVSANWKRFPTKLVSVRPTKLSPVELDSQLRSRPVPIFTIVRADRLLIDLRTVKNDEMDEIISALTES